MATHFHQLAIKDIRRETASCVSILFHIPAHLKTIFSFTQGQNITIKTSINGEELRRSYSICSSPLDNELRIAVKEIEGGRFSGWANNGLTNAAVLEVLPPAGNFYTVLDAGNKKNYMAFAAGSGITPVLSIIKTTLAIEINSRFTLVYGNKNREAIIFKDELEALKNKYMDRFSVHYIFSKEITDAALYQGRIDEKKCAAIFSYLVNPDSCDEFFLCGPAAMIVCIKNFLEQTKISGDKIHFELFTVPGAETDTLAGSTAPPVQPPVERDERRGWITVIADGTSVAFSLAYAGKTILDAGIAAGMDLPFACKGGVCASCRAKLITGEVHMDNNYALEPEEINKGYVLTCQSHPRSEQVLIDFDSK